MIRKLPGISFFIFVLLAVSFIVFQVTLVENDKRWEKRIDEMIETSGSKVTEPLYELIETVEENSLATGYTTLLSRGIMKGYISALPDRFSMYLDEKNYQDYLALSGSNTNLGIGVSLLYDSTKDGIYIVSVYRTSAAEQAGVVPGDIITNIDGVHVNNLGYYSALRLLADGNIGENVNITVKKQDGTNRVLNLVRGQTSRVSVTSEVLGDGIGLVRINHFDAGDDENFKNALASLINSGCEKFVIDVRNNAGRDVETISRMLDFMLPDGPMFTVTDKAGVSNSYTSDTGALPYPIAVVVNENTAYGAEIFASSLQSFATCKVVGMPTYGKATSQEVIPLSSGGAVSLSTAKFTPSKGEDFDVNGVKPDIEVDLTPEAKAYFTTLTTFEDTQIQAAVEHLKNTNMKDIFD